MKSSRKRMQRQAGMAGFDNLGLKVTQAIDFITRFFDDIKLIGLSFGTQVGNQHLAILFIGVGIDRSDDRPALSPENQVITFFVMLEALIEFDAPFGIDLVVHAVIIPVRFTAVIGTRLPP